MIREIGDVRLADDQRRWRTLAGQFNDWRSDWALRASTEHPFENALSGALREHLAIQDLLDLLSDRISSHAEAESTAASERLASLVLLLTIAATVVPLVLVLATPDWMDVLQTPGFVIGVLVLGLVGGVAWRQSRSKR